jgi:hypothetical protein
MCCRLSRWSVSRSLVVLPAGGRSRHEGRTGGLVYTKQADQCAAESKMESQEVLGGDIC